MSAPRPDSRRKFLAAGGLAASALFVAPSVARAAARRRGDRFLCLYLRGGADALNMTVPYAENAYYAARPTLSVGRPDDTNHSAPAIDLDGFFGFHPAMAPLVPLFHDGELAVVHAVGSPDDTRSHFAAMASMERGRLVAGDGSGWLARHLEGTSRNDDSVLRAITTSALTPAFLWGTRSTAVGDLSRTGLEADTERAALLRPLLDVLYQDVEDGLRDEARAGFEAIDALAAFGDDDDSAAPYDDSELATHLRTVARLFREEDGVEVACVDFGGWDTHATQGLAEGIQPDKIASLAQNLAAFREDLGQAWSTTTVAVFSEFGRRLKENGSQGTDHGHGAAMYVLGGPVDGGRVVTDWPGLGDGDLVGPGDLAGTIDYRDVIAEILRKRRLETRLDLVFPGHTVQEVGLVRGR